MVGLWCYVGYLRKVENAHLRPKKEKKIIIATNLFFNYLVEESFSFFQTQIINKETTTRLPTAQPRFLIFYIISLIFSIIATPAEVN